MSNSPAESVYFVGVDGGGSKCRARLESESGEFLGEGLGGPANPLHGIERAKESILSSVKQALAQAGLDDSNLSQVVAGLGLAGVNLPSLYEVINTWDHPFKALYLTTDLHAACLGAHRGGDGAVIVVGTGSCGFSSIKESTLVLGAHGFVLGDKGSGAWLGLEAVKALLLADDDLGPSTVLTKLVDEKLGLDPLALIEYLSSAKSSDYAKLAPLVFSAVEKNDAVATAIVKEGAAYIEAIAKKLLALNPPRLSMIGGISPLLLDWFSEDVVEKISPPLDQPEEGAVHFARAQFASVEVEALQA